MLAWYAIAVMGLNGQVRLFYQDKTWVGLKTLSGRKIPARGIKPKDNGDDASEIREMPEAVIASIVGWKWILDAISVAEI
jgi:hypothetical protein